MLHADLDLSIMIKKLNKTNLLEHAINRQAAFRMAGLIGPWSILPQGVWTYCLILLAISGALE